MRLSSTLSFTTACEDALAFYTACGLGRVTHLLRYGANNLPVHTPAMRGRVVHAQFDGPGVRFFASDDDGEPTRGGALMLVLDDPELTRRLFARLGEGAEVTTPLGVLQPWGFVWQAHGPVRSAVDAKLQGSGCLSLNLAHCGTEVRL